MGIPCICVGDKTSGGGVVVTGSQTDTIDGRAMARVGDKATCHKKRHPHTVTIVTTKDPTMITNGSPQAFHGDKLSCGCTLIASQFSTNASSETSPPITMSVSAENIVAIIDNSPPEDYTHDQRFHLIDSLTGVPLAGQPYRLHFGGTVVDGTADEDGLTEPIGTSVNANQVTWEILGLAESTNG